MNHCLPEYIERFIEIPVNQLIASIMGFYQQGSRPWNSGEVQNKMKRFSKKYVNLLKISLMTDYVTVINEFGPAPLLAAQTEILKRNSDLDTVMSGDAEIMTIANAILVTYPVYFMNRLHAMDDEAVQSYFPVMGADGILISHHIDETRDAKKVKIDRLNKAVSIQSNDKIYPLMRAILNNEVDDYAIDLDESMVLAKKKSKKRKASTDTNTLLSSGSNGNSQDGDELVRNPTPVRENTPSPEHAVQKYLVVSNLLGEIVTNVTHAEQIIDTSGKQDRSSTDGWEMKYNVLQKRYQNFLARIRSVGVKCKRYETETNTDRGIEQIVSDILS